MSKEHEKKSCPFDVLFDIIDDLKEIQKKSSDQHNAKNLQNKNCPSCGSLVPSEQTECLRCGRKL